MTDESDPIEEQCKKLMEQCINLSKLEPTPQNISLREKVAKVILKFQTMVVMNRNIQRQIDEHRLLLSEAEKEVNEIEEELSSLERMEKNH